MTSRLAGPRRVISPTALFRRVDASPDDRVDARAFVRARLMDIFMGDRDRHRDQFRWAEFGDGRPPSWQPISRDHDEAFVQLDGLALRISALYYPPLVRSGRGIRRTTGSTGTPARSTGVSWWRSTARPGTRPRPSSRPAHRRGDRLRRAADAGRDVPGRRGAAGPRAARPARRARARGARVLRLSRPRGRDPRHRRRGGGGGHPVDPHTSTSSSAAATTSQPYFARRFDDRETHEVRLMMWGGDDRVIVRGADAPKIRLRVVGGAGDDRFVDSTRTGGVQVLRRSGHGTRPRGAAGSRSTPGITTSGSAATPIGIRPATGAPGGGRCPGSRPAAIWACSSVPGSSARSTASGAHRSPPRSGVAPGTPPAPSGPGRARRRVPSRERVLVLAGAPAGVGAGRAPFLWIRQRDVGRRARATSSA